MITLYNNIYYFSVDERPALLASLRSRLVQDGALALVSLMQSKTVVGINFDLILRSTIGCAPLPSVEELTAQLRQSGFTRISASPLVPGEALYGVLAC